MLTRKEIEETHLEVLDYMITKFLMRQIKNQEHIMDDLSSEHSNQRGHRKREHRKIEENKEKIGKDQHTTLPGGDFLVREQFLQSGSLEWFMEWNFGPVKKPYNFTTLNVY